LAVESELLQPRNIIGVSDAKVIFRNSLLVMSGILSSGPNILVSIYNQRRAPAVRPFTKYFCSVTYMRITGAIAMREAAKTSPQLVLYAV
jgi:hypothetical protein